MADDRRRSGGSGDPAHDALTSQDLTDAEKLIERIADPEGRPVIFLFGAALTMPGDDAPGVPGVRDVVAALDRELADMSGPVFETARKNEDYGAAYRAGFDRLLDLRGADVVNQVIRRVVLEAHLPLEGEQLRRVLARHVDQHRSECRALLEALDGWHQLRPSVSALGEILAVYPYRFGRVLTTNFDPLIEIAAKRASGQVHRTVLSKDGSPGQHEGSGTHVVYLHGYWFGADTLHTDVQLGKPRPKLEATLRQWLHESLLVVLGYGGWDDVLMRSLRAVADDPVAQPEIAWGFYGSRDPSVVEKLGHLDHRVRFYEHVDLHKLLPQLRDRLTGREGDTEPEGGGLGTRNAESASVSAPERLKAAYRRRKRVMLTGGDITEISTEILELRREIRTGPTLHVGEFLGDGRYELLEEIGQGGFATVWKAYDEEEHLIVAVKVLHGRFAKDRSRRERLFRGAKKMAELRHPNIVRVLVSEGEEHGFYYYVMEFVGGGDLHGAVISKRLDTRQSLEVIEAIAGALEAAHSAKLVHRDVKPQNILLHEDGRPALSDFDLVQAPDSSGGTRTGALGTVIYSAPEQNEDASRVDHRVDIYSLGMTAVFCVYGKKLPHSALLAHDDFLSNLKCNQALRDVLRRAAAIRVQERFESMASFRTALSMVSIRDSVRIKSERPRQDLADVQPLDLNRLVPFRRQGKFQIMASRGGGVLSSVYVAAVGEGSLARLVAVKQLRQGAPDHDLRTRFVDEAKVVVRLNHNNIVDVREAGEMSGQLYIAMELVEGRDLAEMWSRCAEMGRAFPVPLAVYIVREVLCGLHYAHSFPGEGVVHRAVSPNNILIDWAGAVRLADFGLATSAMDVSRTVLAPVFARVGYLAPEQAMRSPLDGRADVYGCGVVLWELLTGRPMRDSETDIQAIIRWEAVPPSSRSKRVDDELDDIVMIALQRSREERFQTAGDFMEALSNWLSEHAPDTTQEQMSEFMNGLFGDMRERDHELYSSLVDDLASLEQRSRQETAARRSASVTTDGETLAPGTIIAQRYRIMEPLGRGGMGMVYLAQHVTVGRNVAVKVLTHEWSEHEVVARRFKEEARAASAAGHPNIVEVFDVGELPDRRLFIVMEFLSGRSLYEELIEKGPLDVLRACRVVRDVARAVRAAHGVGVIHCDLKPDNVMIISRGENELVKVLDFGISACADRTSEERRRMSLGHVIGTPEYMAPEQSKGHPPTEQFDIYALGVMLYEVLAGEPPFVSENAVEMLARKATEAPARLDQRRDGLPPPLVSLVHSSIEVDSNRRPGSADEFLGVLEPIVAALEGIQAIRTPGSELHDYTGPGLPHYRTLPSAYAVIDVDAMDVDGLNVRVRDIRLSDELRRYTFGGFMISWWGLALFGLPLLVLLVVGVWWLVR